jgi:hypothetical protein
VEGERFFLRTMVVLTEGGREGRKEGGREGQR